MKAILARLREPSSWSAIAVLLAIFGLPAPVISVLGTFFNVLPDLVDVFAAVGAAGAGIFMREGAPAPSSSAPPADAIPR